MCNIITTNAAPRRVRKLRRATAQAYSPLGARYPWPWENSREDIIEKHVFAEAMSARNDALMEWADRIFGDASSPRMQAQHRRAVILARALPDVANFLLDMAEASAISQAEEYIGGSPDEREQYRRAFDVHPCGELSMKRPGRYSRA